MIVCNNCGEEFRNEHELALCVVTDNGDGTNTVKLYAGEYEYDETKDEIFRVCPNCLTDGYLADKPSRYKRQYRKGDNILSLDELARQEFVYWHDKLQPRGWFVSWQIRMALDNIGKNGCIFYAIKNE